MLEENKNPSSFTATVCVSDLVGKMPNLYYIKFVDKSGNRSSVYKHGACAEEVEKFLIEKGVVSNIYSSEIANWEVDGDLITYGDLIKFNNWKRPKRTAVKEKSK